MSGSLFSPRTRAPLLQDGPGLLRDSDGRHWPVIDGIPYLRLGRDALVEAAVQRIVAGEGDEALILLLQDQDDWWTGDKPDQDVLRHLVRDRDRLSLRDAMALLAFDRVGDYFAHRWSDPTFLAGLALLQAHWRPAGNAFELACGIGHYGRELSRRNVRFTGGDVVFSKLWLARHWVLPADAALVCFDAAASWPIEDERFDLVFCHDAFYFLEPKAEILRRLRDLAGPTGRVALGHIHNAGAANLSAGRSVSVDALARLFPRATLYDDAELTRALVEARAPRAASLEALATVDAFGVEDRAAAPPLAVVDGLAMPSPEVHLTLNPLYRPAGDDLAIVWPTPRYQAEYQGQATYPARLTPADREHLDDRVGRSVAARHRILVDLPERW